MECRLRFSRVDASA